MTETTTTPSTGDRRYVEPGWFTRCVFNRAVGWLTRAGISVWGSRILQTRGRQSGEWRAVPVNLLELDGATFLVAPRGETQWARNLRVAGGGRLRLGRRLQGFAASELAGDEKVDVLRAYLRRWRWEVGQFFDGVSADATNDELGAIADRHPVFAITLE